MKMEVVLLVLRAPNMAEAAEGRGVQLSTRIKDDLIHEKINS